MELILGKNFFCFFFWPWRESIWPYLKERLNQTLQPNVYFPNFYLKSFVEDSFCDLSVISALAACPQLHELFLVVAYFYVWVSSLTRQFKDYFLSRYRICSLFTTKKLIWNFIVLLSYESSYVYFKKFNFKRFNFKKFNFKILKIIV